MSQTTYGSAPALEKTLGQEMLTGAAALTINLGPGTALAFYQALNGYYSGYFHGDNDQFILRLFFLFAPFPIVFGLQSLFDMYFDAAYSTQVTFPGRLLAVQFALIVITTIWIVTTPTPGSIFVLGALIGTCVAVVNSSGNQLFAAVDPRMLVLSEMGKDLGGLMPIVIFAALGFSPGRGSARSAKWGIFQKDSSDDASVRLALCTILAVCILTSLFYAFLHFNTAALNKGYQRLSYDLPKSDLEDLDEVSTERQTTETTPLQSAPSDGSWPTWIVTWAAAKGLMTAVMYLALSYVSTLSENDSQFLTVLALAMYGFGRILTIPVRRLDIFERGPMHFTLGISVAVRIVLFVITLHAMQTKHVRNAFFLSCWCAMAVSHQFAASLVDITVGAYVEVKDRKFGAMLCTLSSYLGILLGTGGAFVISKL